MMVLKGKNTFQLLIIMIMASLLVAATSIAIVYRVVLGEKKEYLKELSENQVGIIKSIYEERKNPADVLQFLKHQHKLNATLGNTGEFVVGYLKNDTIFYLLDHLKSNFANPKPIAAGSKLGEPMKFALAKRTGIMKGLDYSNDKVLAYCAYLPELQWGIVTKIDISEVNEPFLKAGLYAAIIAIILVSLATFIFKRVSDPIMEELVRSREEWIETFNLIPDLIAILDDKHRIKRANKAMLDKINAGDLEGHNCFQCVHGSDAPPASCPHTLMLKDHKQHITEIYEPILGGDYLVSVTPILDRKGNFKGGIHVARDVTNLRKKELELLKLNRILQALGKSSMAMLKATNEQSYLEEVCQIVVNDCHFAMVWVGYAQNDSEKSVKPVAYSGFEKGYLETLSISWADTERGHGPTGTAIRTGKPATCKNMLTDPAFAPWREEALKRGYSSSLVLPLIDENKPFGAITIYSVDPDPFTEEETDFLSELASDLSHGILSIRAKIARAKAEEELRQSEQRLKHHFENSPLAVVEWDAEFIVTKWSAEAEHIFGWKAEETIGKPIGTLNIIYEEDIPIVNRTMERLTSGKENTVISANRNYTKSGKIIHCTWYNSILFDGEGKMESVMSLVDDITERKAMEEALQINSKRLEILSQTTSRLLATRNPRTVVNEICAEAMKFLNCQVFFNYILDEKAGKLNLNAYAGIPEKTAKEIEWLEMGASVCGFVALEKQRVVAEKIQETPDPKTDLVKSFGIKAYACHPLLSQEKVIGTLSFGTGTRNSFSDDDIALMKAIADQVAIGLNRVKDEEALLRSEEQYRKLVEISPYAVFINRNNRISFVNPAAVKLFGATNSEEIVGKTPFDIFPPDTHSIVKQRVEKVLTGEPVPIIEIRIRQLDGSERDVEVTGSKFTDQEGVAIQVILRDITERKQAQAIKTRYQLISEYARDPLLLVSVHGEIVEANRAATEFYGYSYQELLNLRIHDLRKNKDGLINNQIVQARQKGILFETIHIRKDGTTVPVEVSSRGVMVDGQEMILSVIRDVTERKKSEQSLREHAKMLEHAPVLVRNLNDEIIIWNNGMEKIYGFRDEETVGKVYRELLQTQYPQPLEEIFGQLYDQGKWEGELQHKGKDGQIVLVLSSWILYKDEHNDPIAIIEVDKDITKRKKAEKELKESEEKLKLALENGSIGVWVWDIATNDIEWDERMERMFGVEPGSFGKTYDAFEVFLVEEDVPHTRNAIKKALEEDVHFETVYRIKSKDGDIKHISAKALVTKDSKGKPVKMTGVCFDITAMKKDTEQVLFSLNEELLRSNKELEQFAYVASHDLQEPLRMVSSFTQLLAQRYKNKLDQDAKDFIQFAVDGASRMQTLINDLLAFSRIQTRGKEFSDVDMHEVLAKVMYNLNVKIQEKNALVTIDELPVVFADEGQMVQLFQNLVGNAIKFSAGTPVVHISSQEENDHFIFSVKDNGIGIEKQYFERIFQIFQRLQPKDEYEGTGIGLAICKRVVERHGGRIWVESELDKGTTFYFTIRKPIINK